MYEEISLEEMEILSIAAGVSPARQEFWLKKIALHKWEEMKKEREASSFGQSIGVTVIPEAAEVRRKKSLTGVSKATKEREKKISALTKMGLTREAALQVIQQAEVSK